MKNDFELLKNFANDGSEAAFRELVRRHAQSVFAVVKRRVGGDIHLAQDVTQRVFTDLARKAGRLTKHRPLISWLFVAARYASTDAVRREQSKKNTPQDTSMLCPTDLTPVAEPDWEKVRPLIDEFIQDLNEQDRSAVLLYYFEKRSYVEIAAELGLSESGARMRADRAVDKLRRSLSKRGIVSTSGVLASALGSQGVVILPLDFVATVGTVAVSGVPQVVTGGTFSLFTGGKVVTAAAIALIGVAIVGLSTHRKLQSRPHDEAVVHGDTNTVLKSVDQEADRLKRLDFTTPHQLTSESNSQRNDPFRELKENGSVSLTGREWSIVDELVDQFVRSREKLELALARSEVVQPGLVVIAIPEYHEAGLELYVQFGEGIIAAFGDQRGKALMTVFELPLRRESSDFGIRPQTITVEDKGKYVSIRHQSGFGFRVNGRLQVADRSGGSTLMWSDLSIYSYLLPLFPQRAD